MKPNDMSELRHAKTLRSKGTPLCFSAIFTKGNNFCDFQFASIDNQAF